MNKKFLIKSAMIAALYVVIMFLFSSISFGPFQIRLAMALELFSFFTPAGIVGTTVGTLLSNILFGGLGVIDAVIGTIITWICSSLIYLAGKRGKDAWYVAWMIPIIPTAVLVNLILYLVLNIPFYPTIIFLICGNSLSMLIGYIVFSILKRNKTLMDLIK